MSGNSWALQGSRLGDPAVTWWPQTQIPLSDPAPWFCRSQSYSQHQVGLSCVPQLPWAHGRVEIGDRQTFEAWKVRSRKSLTESRGMFCVIQWPLLWASFILTYDFLLALRVLTQGLLWWSSALCIQTFCWFSALERLTTWFLKLQPFAFSGICLPLCICQFQW